MDREEQIRQKEAYIEAIEACIRWNERNLERDLKNGNIRKFEETRKRSITNQKAIARIRGEILELLCL